LTIYLYENLNMVPGQNGEYIKAFAERYLPLYEEYDTGNLLFSGMFMPDIMNSTQPRIVILWTIPSWESWANRNFSRDAVETLRKNTEFYHPALAWRTGWTDKILDALPFSPAPPVWPDSARPGALVFDHQYQVKPEHGADFVKVFKEEIMPASEADGLTLELIARSAGKPFEFVAIWSASSRAEYCAWHDRRSTESNAFGIPGLDAALPFLTNLEERELGAVPISPLAGRRVSSKTAGGLNAI
jgi:hypothetical protein